MGDADRLAALDYDAMGAVGDYLLDCQDRGLRPRTILLKAQRLEAMAAYVGMPLEQLDELSARRWWRSLTRRGLSPATRGIYLSHARAFYAWAMRQDVVTLDPTRKLVSPKRPRGVPRDLDPGAVVAVIQRAPARTALAMALMLWGGLRCAEVARVRGQDVITRDAGDVVLRVYGKGGTERVVKLPSWLADAVRARGNGWTFPSVKGAGPVCSPTVGTWVATTLRAGGIDATAHQLRHTNATTIYRRTGDVLLLQAHLGHATLATVQVYARAVGVSSALMESLYPSAVGPLAVGDGTRLGGQPGDVELQPGVHAG